MEKIALTDIATVKQGYQFRKRIDFSPKGAFKVIQMANIKDNEQIGWKHLNSVSLKDFKKENLIQQDDIILCARGRNNYAIHIDTKVENTIAVSQFHVIRVLNKKIDQDYLAWYLNQSEASNYLKTNATTGTVPIINRAVLEKIEISVPPLELQKKISRVHYLRKKEIELRKDIIHKRKLLIDTCLKKSIEA